jgi:tRNA/rRNA methyltransferase
VGASARAIKTMGFTSLRLVRPCDHLCDEAQMLAHGSVDVLKNAAVYPSLRDALHGIDLVIGTTAKKRMAKNDYYSCDAILECLVNKGNSVRNAGVVFGRERCGLSNTELQQCDILSTIPMKASYPSLNLSQTVMLYAYTLSPLALGRRKRQSVPGDAAEMRILLRSADLLMKAAGIKSLIHNRIMERIPLLGKNDIHLLLSVCNKLGESLPAGNDTVPHSH